MTKLSVREWVFLGGVLVTMLGAVINYMVSVKVHTLEMEKLKRDVYWCSDAIWRLSNPDDYGPPTPPPSFRERESE
jgi:hypothetical protein